MKIIAIIFLLTFRWSHEPILANKDASACHFIGSAYLVNSMQAAGLKWWQADLAALGSGLAWEVKDGLVPWERHGWIGGEGFSRGDLLCDLTGIVSNRLFNLAVDKIRKKVKDAKAAGNSDAAFLHPAVRSIK